MTGPLHIPINLHSICTQSALYLHLKAFKVGISSVVTCDFLTVHQLMVNKMLFIQVGGTFGVLSYDVYDQGNEDAACHIPVV
jgi:hypothetical protein